MPAVPSSASPSQPGGASPAQPAPPAQIGEWQLVRRLGRGAMGEVWLGRHVVSGARGAVKVVRDAGPGVDRLRRFFAREGRAVARLRHPHIAAVFEIGIDHLVTAYIDGGDLARRLQSPIDPATAVHFTRQIAAALAHAHSRGVVHRDVKPGNILLDTRQNAYLVDFGLALLDDSMSAEAPRAGTPSYMAPEQAKGHATGPAADQYALARTLMEMLSGERPPPDSKAALARLPESLPEALRQAIARATEQKPERRFADIEIFADTLADIDLSAVAAPSRLAAEVRLRKPFTWCAGPRGGEALTPDLARADYKLTELIAAGLLPEAAARRMLERAGMVELGWSVYGRTARLGALGDPAAFARAGEIVVLLHGWAVNRSVWRHVAEAICRDNAQALVLAPDVYGFGESRFVGKPTLDQLLVTEIPRLTTTWLDLLGLRDFPTVMVGHSMSAVALLSIGDDELAPRVSRVAINPIWPSFDAKYRRKLAFGRVLTATVARIPALRPWLSRTWVNRAPGAAELSPAAREMMIAEYEQLGRPTMARGLSAFGKAKVVTAERQRRLSLMINMNDPIVDPEATKAALAALQLGAEQVHQLATGGHFAHLEDEAHPEWTARNLAEIAHLVDTMLLTSREGTLLPTEVASTLMGGSDTSLGGSTAPVTDTDRDSKGSKP